MKEQFLKQLEVEKRYSPRTIELYSSALAQFALYLNPQLDESLEQLLDPKNIRAYTASLMERGLSPSTVNLHLSAISSYCNYLLSIGQIQSNPVKKGSRPKMGRAIPQFYRESALKSYGEERREGLSEVRDQMIVLLLYSSGIRRGELVQLTLSDLDLARSLLRVRGKGDKVRQIPLPNTTIESLREYLELYKEHFEYRGDNHLFLTDRGKPLYLSFVNRVVKRELAKFEGFEGKKSPHLLRHSLATHLLNNGADLNSIKELLGHSSLAATQLYTHTQFSKLKEIYSTAHPRAQKRR